MMIMKLILVLWLLYPALPWGRPLPLYFQQNVAELAHKSRQPSTSFNIVANKSAPLSVKFRGGDDGGHDDYNDKRSHRPVGLCDLPVNNGFGLRLQRIYRIIVRPLLSLGFWYLLFNDRRKLINIILWFFQGTFVSVFVMIKNFKILHVYDPGNDNMVSVKTQNPTEQTCSDPFYYGLDVSRQNFRRWVGHHLGGDSSCVKDDAIRTRLYVMAFSPVWRDKKLQAAWREGRLLGTASINGPIKIKDHLCDQYVRVLEDELEDDRDHSQILTFLRNEYGPNITRLEAVNWNQESDDMKLEIMQNFLDWFRSTFPYYYNKCDSCGTSCTSVQEVPNTCLGLLCPNTEERTIGKAGQVEVYGCSNCGSVTRFPRFNAAIPICRNRRGRCGEYSLLLLRMLQALGHACRYVVDYGNGHIWSEVQWNGTIDRINSNQRWLHLDPSEAAVNKNLLYQEWGRRLTTVLAFCAPPFAGNDSRGQGESIPIVEDVTDHYKSPSESQKFWFHLRRKTKTTDKASAILRDKIAKLREEKTSRNAPAEETKDHRTQSHHQIEL